MKLSSSILRAPLLTALFFFAFLAGQARAETGLGEHAGTVPVPPGLSAAEVQKTIVMVLAARHWNIREKSDGRVAGYLKHRGNEATVRLVYDTTKVDLYCEGWAIDKNTGERKKPEQPKGWLKNIQSDLTKILNRMVASNQGTP